MNRKLPQIGLVCATALLLVVACAGWSADIADATFLRVTVPATGWLSSLRRVDDTNRVEFIRPGETLGVVSLRVRAPGSPWSAVRQGTNGIELRSGFRPHGEGLRWEINITNTGSEPLEIGDLALPLPMNTDYVWDHV